MYSEQPQRLARQSAASCHRSAGAGDRGRRAGIPDGCARACRRAGGGWAGAWLAVERFGFHDAAFDHMASTGQMRPEWLWQLVTYPFVHYSLTHALFGVVILLALGNYASKLYSPVALLVALFRLRGGGGGDLWADREHADAADRHVSGSLWADRALYLDAVGGGGGAGAEPLCRLPPDRGAGGAAAGLRPDRRVLSRGWFADIAGFALGFALATPLAPGGLQRLRRRLRGY